MDHTERKTRLKYLLDESDNIGSAIQKRDPAETLQSVRDLITSSYSILSEGKIEDYAEHTTEVVLDAQVMKKSHDLVSKVLQQNPNFTEKTYQNAINNIIYKSDTVDWDALAEIACRIPFTVRVKSTMLGAVEMEVKERVAKERQQRKKRSQLGEETRLKMVDKLKRRDKGAQKVNIVHRQLAEIFSANDRRPVPYYKVIIDKNNFMNTVENAFQIAFLVNENKVAIETGDDGYPHIRLPSKDEKRTDSEPMQSICSLNIQLCQEMIIFYNIDEPMLKVSQEEDISDTDEEED